MNFDGTDIRFFSRSHVRFADESTVEDLNGEAVNDAVCAQRTKVGDRLGTHIVNIFDGGANHGSTGEMRQIIAAGSDEYVIFTASMHTLSPDAIMGSCYDWLEIPYVDTKPDCRILFFPSYSRRGFPGCSGKSRGGFFFRSVLLSVFIHL